MSVRSGGRPRELQWYHAASMVFGDWGTSRLYVLGLAFYYTHHAAIWHLAALSVLSIAMAWAFDVVCGLLTDGGSVYSATRNRSQLLAVLGTLLLCTDYVVTASISAFDAFRYLGLAYPAMWAAGSILLIGAANIFGPLRTGTAALVVAVATVALTLVVAGAAAPAAAHPLVTPVIGGDGLWWVHFCLLTLAISGVESIASLTGILTPPVKTTARRAIWVVAAEISVVNLILVAAMQAVPLAVLGDGDPTNAFTAHRDDMVRLLASYYVSPAFAAVLSFGFALLLLSAANTVIACLVSIQYSLARDGELPAALARTNRWGVPVLPLTLATLVAAATVVGVPDVAHLANLYTLGLMGAIAILFVGCATDSSFAFKPLERGGLLGLAALSAAVFVTVAWLAPLALAYVGGVVAVGLAAHALVENRVSVRRWMLTTPPNPIVFSEPQAEPIPIPAPRILGGWESRPAPKPIYRVLLTGVPTLELFRLAAEEAMFRAADLLVLPVAENVWHVSTTTPDGATPAFDSQEALRSLRGAAAGERVRPEFLPALQDNVVNTILETTVAHGVRFVVVGANRKDSLTRLLSNRSLIELAERLPAEVHLLICS